jgi:hypothetical protein
MSRSPVIAFRRNATASSGKVSNLMPPAEEELLMTRRLGDFELIREVGRGGIGVVLGPNPRPIGDPASRAPIPHG